MKNKSEMKNNINEMKNTLRSTVDKMQKNGSDIWKRVMETIQTEHMKEKKK